MHRIDHPCCSLYVILEVGILDRHPETRKSDVFDIGTRVLSISARALRLVKPSPTIRTRNGNRQSDHFGLGSQLTVESPSSFGLTGLNVRTV